MPYSEKDNHIIVSYHYVKNPSKDFSGIYPCPRAEFEKQIEYLTQEYRIAPIEDVYAAATSKSTDRLCALTFDDGTRDHLENVVPILKRYGVFGTFFIITQTFDGKLTYSHKGHILLSRFDIDTLIDNFNAFIANHYSDLTKTLHIPKNRGLTKTKRADFGGDVRRENFKEIITTAPYHVRDKFLNAQLEHTGMSESEWAATLYMNAHNIKQILKDGHTIGNHTHTHNVFDTMSDKELQKELNTSNGYFEKLFSFRPKLLSYPYGRATQRTEAILNKNGFTCAVTIERRGVLKLDSPLALPRYDTNDIRDFLKEHT